MELLEEGILYMITMRLLCFHKGVILGGISAFMEQACPGIAIQAVGLTSGVLFALLFIYKARIIKVTDNFQMGVFVATGGIVLYYFVSIILGFFGMRAPLSLARLNICSGTAPLL